MAFAAETSPRAKFAAWKEISCTSGGAEAARAAIAASRHENGAESTTTRTVPTGASSTNATTASSGDRVRRQSDGDEGKCGSSCLLDGKTVETAVTARAPQVLLAATP